MSETINVAAVNEITPEAKAMLDEVTLQCSWGFSAFRYPGLSSFGYGWVVAFAKDLRPFSLELVRLGDPRKVISAHSEYLSEAIVEAASMVMAQEGIPRPTTSESESE